MLSNARDAIEREGANERGAPDCEYGRGALNPDME